MIDGVIGANRWCVCTERMMHLHRTDDAFAASRWCISARIIFFRLCQSFGLAYVKPVLAVYRIALYAGFATYIHIERYNGEFARPLLILHIPEDGRGEDMNATECLQLVLLGRIIQFRGQYFARREIGPAAKAVLSIHQQIAGGIAVIGKQRGIGIAFQVVAVEGLEVEIRQDVGIVYEERFTAFEQRACFLDASARIEQHIPFVTDVYIYAKVIIGMQEINNLLAKVMDIDCDVIESRFFQPKYHPLQHRFSGYRNEGFGHVVRQRTQAAA